MAINEEDKNGTSSDATLSESSTPSESAAPSDSAASSESSTAPSGGSAAPSGSSAAPSGSSAGPSNLPLWPGIAFLVGLGLLYLGQRVVLTPEWLPTTLSGLAGLLIVGSTGYRFLAMAQVGGERGKEHAAVSRVLLGLQVLGLIGVGLYFLSGDWGAEKLGVTDPEELANVQAVLEVIWTLAVSVSVLGLCFAELALNPMRNAAHVEGRRVQMAALSGAVLALAAGYGSLFVYAATQAETQVDYSYFKTSEPGESTLKLVEKMAEPVKVTAFYPQVSEVRKEVKTYLQRLKDKTGNIDYQIVDRYLEPKLAKELKATQDGAVILAKGESSEKLVIPDELRVARGKLKALDKDFNSKLYKLLRSRRTAYLTSGHGELNDPLREAERSEGRSANLFKKLLEQQNYRVKNLGLAQGLAGAVPDDAAIVFILGPTIPFAPEEIAALKRYAEGGGKLLLALDADAVTAQQLITQSDNQVQDALASVKTSKNKDTKSAPNNSAAKQGSAKQPDTAQEKTQAKGEQKPGEVPSKKTSPAQWLVDLAAAVGVNYDPTLIADANKHVPRHRNPSDRTILFTNRFSSHASVSTLGRNSARAAVIFSGSGSFTKKEGSDVKMDPTVRSYSSAFADTNGDFNRDGKEESHIFNLGVALTKPVEKPAAAKEASKEKDKKDKKDKKGEQDAEEGAHEMRAFVLGDADALSDLFMANFPSNQMLAFDAVRWLGGEESLAGEVESEEDVRIEHTKQKDLVWFYSTIFGVPLIVLGMGVFISRRTRKGGKR